MPAAVVLLTPATAAAAAIPISSSVATDLEVGFGSPLIPFADDPTFAGSFEVVKFDITITGLDTGESVRTQAGHLVGGILFGGIILILVSNGRIEPVEWTELLDAAGAMALVLVVGYVVDLVMMPVPSVAVVQARVDTCNGRWAFMWLLGFGGTAVMAFTGRPQTFFQVFAVLKATWEMWGLLARTFGWKSLQDGSEARLGGVRRG